MAPDSRIYPMRHGQAEHNVDQDFSKLDDAMTPVASNWLLETCSNMFDIYEIRALYTTLLGWKPAIERLGISNVVVLPEAQECLDFPCDTGSPLEELERETDFQGLDFSRLTPDWTSKKGFWAPDDASLANRTKFVRQFLRDRPEKNIVLVCHGDFLRQLTADAEGPSPSYWKNVEMRVYKFDAETVDRDECFFKLEEAPDATRGYAPKTTEADFDAAPNGKI